MGMTKTEAEVARRLDAGETREAILRDSGIHPTIGERVCNWSSTGNERAAESSIRMGSRSLLKALQRAGFA
jgi:hypothetical protein